MNLRPSEQLSDEQVETGLKLVVKDGLAAEAMTALTGGTFLVALALYMGASNFQIGLLASLPTFTNIFQLITIWIVQKYNNRRAIAVVSNFLARFPLLVIGSLPFLFSHGTSLQVLIFVLFFHYLFGSLAGPSWNSWMKDLVPEKRLGSYFSHRGRLTQSLNVILSLAIAVSLDYIKAHYPSYEITAYSIMFLIGGAIGMLGVYFLSGTPEPKTQLTNQNIFRLLGKPVKDKNFRKLLTFNAFWLFSINLATPFFSVYLMKTIGLPLSYIIALGILTQLSSIFSIKLWGKYSDQFSNKTIITICAPLYVACITAWAFIAMPSSPALTIAELVVINIFSGIATAGINLALTNIGLKLAPKNESIVYLTSRSMINALFSAIAPIVGGTLADYFGNRELTWSFQWKTETGVSIFKLLALEHWSFLFVIGAVLAMLSLRLLKGVKEEGEVTKDTAVTAMKINFKTRIKESPVNGLISNTTVLPGYFKKIAGVGKSNILFKKR